MDPRLQALERQLGPGDFMRLMSQLERSRPASSTPAENEQYLEEMVAEPYETAPWAKPQQEAFARKPTATEAVADKVSAVLTNMGLGERDVYRQVRKARELADWTPYGIGANAAKNIPSAISRGNAGETALDALGIAFPVMARMSPLTGVTTKGFRKLMGGGRERTANEQHVRSGLLDAYSNQQKLRNAQEAAGFSRLPRQEIGVAVPQQRSAPLGKLAAGTAAGGLAMLPSEAEADVRRMLAQRGIALADLLRKHPVRRSSNPEGAVFTNEALALMDLDRMLSPDEAEGMVGYHSTDDVTGETTGAAAVHENDERAYLMMLGSTKKGAGTELMERILKDYSDRPVTLESTPESEGFYEKMGGQLDRSGGGLVEFTWPQNDLFRQRN